MHYECISLWKNCLGHTIAVEGRYAEGFEVFSQFGQQGVLEERLFVSGQKQAFVRSQVFDESVCCVSILGERKGLRK